ncbi:MAG: hypothetical protein PWP31_1183 [Clostridia bacterium]|nr:hypothetical protein [Clostridia bacterium]
MINNIEVRYWRVNSKNGYDLKILSPNATLADYIKALEDVDINRLCGSYNQTGQCKGCGDCCKGRLPLTNIDTYLIRIGLKELINRELSIDEVLKKYCQVKIEGQSVDITLKTDVEGYCIFLDPNSNSCRLYKYRPLICRTYYCCILTQKAKLLRELLVNKGEDELVRMWLSLQKSVPLGVNKDDWEPTPFANCHKYSEVFLKDICPSKLWRQLIK